MKFPRLLFASALVFSFVFGTSYFASAALGGSTGVRIPYTGVLERNGVLVAGEVDFTFAVYNVSDGGSACYTSGALTTTASSGRFSVVIGPVPEACVAGRELWLEITVDDGSGPATMPGRQRVYPAVSSVSSGSGDFHVGGGLTVTNALTVSGSTQLASVNITGDVSVGGVLNAGYYVKSCYDTDSCACNSASDRVISGGPDCDFVDGSAVMQYSHPLNNTSWYAACEGTAAGRQFIKPIEIRMICARIR